MVIYSIDEYEIRDDNNKKIKISEENISWPDDIKRHYKEPDKDIKTWTDVENGKEICHRAFSNWLEHFAVWM